MTILISCIALQTTTTVWNNRRKGNILIQILPRIFMNNFTPSDWCVFKQILAIDSIQGHATCKAMCQTTSDADAD